MPIQPYHFSVKSHLSLAARVEERENHIRESWVKAMEVRLVAEQLSKCHQTEGVNHYENCKWLADKYLSMLKTNKVCPSCTYTFSSE